MAVIELRSVTRTQGNNAAIKNRVVQPEGYSLVFEEVTPLVSAFRRMVRGLEFDVCEMAITTYLCARAHGKPFTAIPVFLVRGFHHGAIAYNTGSGIRVPRDLEGRRVGVNRGYTVTTGVWARGILADEYGVDLDSVTWLRSSDEHVAEYVPPPNVETLADGSTLEDLVASGELPAAVGADMHAAGVAPLIPDAEKAALDALQSSGLYPINHLVVIRDDVLAGHPDVAAALFEAFAESKRRYLTALKAGSDNSTPTDQLYRRVLEVTGEDPLPYGIEPNRAVLETLLRYAVDQHILAGPLDIETLFAAGTRDVVG
ncbi:MAG: ABC transporter substrate-binding protein [Actinobacteria bacterium]|nr:ABC transporter substrate-binding protein [Actinomycetota bacterium]MBO0835240.1 ABC transporter substrate-binding protein [Actinomycetota bacterium]